MPTSLADPTANRSAQDPQRPGETQQPGPRPTGTGPATTPAAAYDATREPEKVGRDSTEGGGTQGDESGL